MATAVAEAEASIPSIRQRHSQGAAKLWVNLHTLPRTHPLGSMRTGRTMRFVSPLQKIARAMDEVQVDRMETIQEYAIPPWEPRLRATVVPDRKKAAEMASRITGIVTATSSSVKKGIVGMGGITQDTLFNRAGEAVTRYAVTLGTREEQSPYTAELAAIAMTLKNMPPGTLHRHITVTTRSLSALAAIQQPRQQSGQSIIRQIYESAELLKQGGNSVDFIWIPAETNFKLGDEAKTAAQSATKQRRAPELQPH